MKSVTRGRLYIDKDVQRSLVNNSFKLQRELIDLELCRERKECLKRSITGVSHLLRTVTHEPTRRRRERGEKVLMH
jgi:hypothetical protein